MKNIQDFNFLYWFIKPYVCFCFRLFYKRICIEGLENIPKDKVVIFAPNHQNALMDALAILATYKGSIVFLARADIFANKRVAKILNSLKIMPVYRIRDGRENLNRNTEIFDKAVDVLQDGAKLCLMPEGKQSFQRKLLPLVKGLCRIAFGAQEAMKGKEVVVLPVGIDYEDYINSGGDLIIRFGSPISLSEHMSLYNEDQARALNILREQLYDGISGLIQNIHSEAFYSQFYELSLIADSDLCHALQQKETSIQLLEARRNISSTLDEKLVENPKEIADLLADFQSYNELLKISKLQDKFIANPPKIFSFLAKSLCLLISLPLFFYGWLANCIPAYMPLIVVNKLKDESFKSSFKFVLWLITYTLYYIILLVAVGSVFQSVWWLLSVFFSFTLLGYFAFWYRKWAKSIFFQIHCFSLGADRKNQLSVKREKIINYILKNTKTH